MTEIFIERSSNPGVNQGDKAAESAGFNAAGYRQVSRTGRGIGRPRRPRVGIHFVKLFCAILLLSGFISIPAPIGTAMAGSDSGAPVRSAPMRSVNTTSAKNSSAASGKSGSAEVVATATEARKRLAETGYLAVGSHDNPSQISEERSRYAILAFERVEGRKQTGKLDPTDLEALRTAARPMPRETGYAHIEIDLTRQVLFVVDSDSTVTLTLPVSSGSGKMFTFQGKTERAVTPRGRFTVYNKIGGWRKAPLGMIYYPCYFDKGVAIHGSRQVPNYPASHGCVRIPIVTAKELSDLTPVGTVVLVYDGEQVSSNASAHWR
jgi:lipoprotein-anchoring transpeptidase ErfK/SrfK